MRVDGVQRTIRKLQRFGEQGNNVIKTVTAVAAHEIVTKASQKLASYSDVDPNGQIAQSINTFPVNNGKTWKLAVNQVPMAAYIEFGTGVFVEVADEWKDIAWQFYVNGRGYMHPHPYLYPAYQEGLAQYKIDLRDSLINLTRRTNRS